MKKELVLCMLENELTEEEFDIAIKLSHIKFDKEKFRSQYYQSILDGYINLENEWKLFSPFYNKYENSLIIKLKNGDTEGVDTNNPLVRRVMEKNKIEII
tara:strand:+ start:62559 stop:62858 length:300 start_codon:yes stop_codon:yes gene_type:complete